jgi:putative hydrolase of the HAD superfamily
MYKAIIFDFFGVFCPDTTLEWFKKAAPDYKAKLPEFQAICTRSDYGQLNKRDFYEEISQLANVSVNKIIIGVEAETIINTDLVTFVEGLAGKGYKTACLSNGTHEWTLEVIRNHGLDVLFDEIVLSGDLGVVKPDPRIYLYTLEKLGAEASQAIFVDDRNVNTDAAEKCGIRSILFKDTGTFIKEFEDLTASK